MSQDVSTSAESGRGSLVPWSADQLQQATRGQWHNLEGARSFSRISTDTRAIEAGDVFLALQGARFNAHDFLADAVNQGAQALIVSRFEPALAIPQLLVADTRLALGQLGAYRRAQYPQLTVLALTGSSGKTTVKEMLGSILRQQAPTLVTRGNLNNDLGVPLMLLELRPDHHYAALELGANHVGEIDYTSGLVRPQVAGVLNIGTAHVGEFGGRAGIARAKSEIFAHLAADGIAVIPARDDFSEVIAQAASAHTCLSFGQGGQVFAQNISLHATHSQFELVTPHGRIDIDLPFAGQHNIDNALAAASFALAIDISLPTIAQGLAQAVGAKGRLNFIQQGQWLIIDDTYNANPHSVLAAAQVLTAQAGRKILVLGDIGELGSEALAAHYQLGQALASYGLDALFAVGEFAPHTIAGFKRSNPNTPAHSFVDKQALLARLTDFLQQGESASGPRLASLLFKGSRYTKMESLIADLMALPAGDGIAGLGENS